MSEKRDHAIKLFGKTIQLGSNLNGDTSAALMVEPSADVDCNNFDQNMPCSKQSENRGDEKAPIGHTMQEEEPSSSSGLEESKAMAIPSTTTIDNPKSLSNDKESSSQDLSKKEDESDQTSSNHHSQDQCPPKKPDKILPCPRCNSMDTKFCYFNNYNVSQPRHFCKNCQRYWTAGGSMRNVPVGAGRRKNKTASSLASQPNGLIHHALRPNGTLLACGSDSHSPLPESMASMLKLAEKSPICPPNGFIDPETRNVDVTSNTAILNTNPLVCFSGSSWPYTWNPIPFPSGFPVSFYSPPPYLQWLQTPSIFPDESSTTSNPDSPSLGKHSREKKSLESSRFVIPKTMRIDDPTDAAKSSIWSTLEIKNDKVVGSSNVVGGFFRGFELTKDVDNQYGNQSDEESSMALQANPAAFSRSSSFHENA